MKFLFCWALIIVLLALAAAAIGLQVLGGFILGAVTVIGASLAVGIAASAYDRGDEWDP
jgi:hypothetical protein